jgi:hypothetical protein
MSRILNAKIQRITEHTLVIGVDVGKKTHVKEQGTYRNNMISVIVLTVNTLALGKR